jgi:ribosomal protein L19
LLGNWFAAVEPGDNLRVGVIVWRPAKMRFQAYERFLRAKRINDLSEFSPG